MTERDMQNIVAFAVQQPRDLALVPNCGALGHEADLARLTDKRMLHEIEIKVSRSDFLADRKKVKRYKLDHPEHFASVGGRARVPHYFWYAVLADVATVDDLPKYAGLIVVDPRRNRARVERRATLLHKEPLPDRAVDYLLRGQALRYWQERDGINPTREQKELERRQMREWREREKRRREARA